MSKAPSTPGDGGRRLAAIVFTDVAGYSARMQQDETGTLALVRADFEKMRAHCAQHGGEVLKSTGDGLLLCFASVVQAVACALRIQEEFAARPAEALQHRIGIHLGDVFREGGDVTGDGVNIAARLQTKARPGTICLSQSVYHAVKGKLPMQAKSLGPQQFKNIAEPITVYLVVPAGTTLPAAIGKKSRAGWMVAAVLVAAVVLGVVFWPKPPPPAGSKPAALPPPSVPVADRSIAVLPFTNMSDDKDSGYFADGVHEDLLTNLANISALKVISRTSMVQYRDTKKPLRQIGGELGVAYILEGSVRHSGNKIRVTGQLINARTDEHVWAKTYDRDLTDVFAVQTDLSREIATALQAALSPQENARLEKRPTQSMAAYELFQRAMVFIHEGVPKVSLTQALPLLEQAVKIDPQYAQAWVQIGWIQYGAYWRESRPPARLRGLKEAFARAEESDPDNIELLFLGAAVMALPGGDPARVSHYRQRIIELYPNRAESYRALARMAIVEARWEDALACCEKARAMDPLNTGVLGQLELVLLAIRHFDQAEEIQRAILRLEPGNYDVELRLATTPFMRTGSTREFEALLARLSGMQKPDDAAARNSRLEIMIMLGDAAGMIRLWRESGENLMFREYSVRDARMLIAAAFIAGNDFASAKPLLEKNRDEALKALAGDPEAAESLNDLGLALAMLGDQEAGRKRLAQARALIERLPPDQQVFLRWQNVICRSWAGEKAEAIAGLREILTSRAMANLGVNVHDLETSLLVLPLHGEPDFKAMLQEPKNNAPMF